VSVCVEVSLQVVLELFSFGRRVLLCRIQLNNVRGHVWRLGGVEGEVLAEWNLGEE
jgi:hypothetical protein